MKVIDDSKIKETIKEIEQKFQNERTGWNEKFISVIEQIKDTSKVIDAQITQLSYRQIIVEMMICYKAIHEKKQEEFDKMVCSRFKSYSIEADLKLTGAEKQQFCQSDLATWKYQLKLISLQIEWCQESIKLLDNLGFAIKNKIQLTNEMMIG